MGIVLVLLGAVIALAGMAAWVITLKEAWTDEVWKGLLFLLIPLYALYYGAFEFDHDHKWPIFLAWFFGLGAGGWLIGAGMAMMQAR